jgi:hypothetical protein
MELRRAVDVHSGGMKTQNGGVDAKNRAVEDSCRFSSHEHDLDPQRSENLIRIRIKRKVAFCTKDWWDVF